ncbi:hypothetical protein ACP70R_037939 [Stipagrostis hirtigluma subsp. patula]
MRTEKSVFRFLQDRDAADSKHNLVSRHKEQDIPVDWMSDAGLIAKIKLACVNLEKQCLMRVASEIDGLSDNNGEQNREAALFRHKKSRTGKSCSIRVSGLPSGFIRPSHVSGSAQLLGFLALAVTLTALLLLAGITLTGALAALVILSPLVLLTVPLWAPVAVVVSLTGAASLLACCAGVAAAAAGTWAHRYLTGRHPVGGAHRVEPADYYAQGHVMRAYYDAYAREHGGYPRPQRRVKDAAPGA